jgi:hypothetical protein
VEYALGQLHDGQSSEENARILQVEYENLVQGEAFREGFEELALEYGMSLPSKSICILHYEMISHLDDTRVLLQSQGCYSRSLRG